MNLSVEKQTQETIQGNTDSLESVREMVKSCIQCGTCSASCPNASAMDLTPRQLWRNVLMGNRENIFKSKTFTLCSACYYCTLRCPRGLSLTEAMSVLKQIAARENMSAHKSSIQFYRSFMDSVRRHGRVHEMEFMTLFFMGMKNPFLPLKFAPLGLRLMSKGKVPFEVPSKEPNALTAIFNKVDEMERRS